jgi:hypothetical protein
MAFMNTQDFRDAVNGDGPLANEWKDKPHRLIYDLCNAVDNASVPIFQVTAEHLDGPPRLLGHATGQKADIEAFYADQKGYGLALKQVQVQNIPPGFAQKRATLLQQKEQYQKEIDRINAQLKHFGGRQ